MQIKFKKFLLTKGKKVVLQGVAGFYKEGEEAPRKEEAGGITFCSSIPGYNFDAFVCRGYKRIILSVLQKFILLQAR
jgi:hypothetical protein